MAYLGISRQQLAQNSKILIVEDNRFERMVLRHILEASGFIDIADAANGVEGFAQIHNNMPDLIVLDIEMPEMDGLEFCQKINSDPLLKHIPIIVQTIRTRIEDKEKIFDVGACDYVAKPIDQREFIARVFSQLERALWLSELTKFHCRVQEELAMASQTQKVLIPDATLLSSVKNRYQIKVQHHQITSSELGGDFWGVYQLSDNKLIVYIVDFSGHGINAALNTFRLHTLMQQLFSHYDDPGHYMTELNAKLAEILPTGQFATMFYGIIDIDSNSLSYATAGCPPPLIFNDNGDVITIDGAGYLLGTMPQISYETKHIAFAPGDMLFLYSDALLESPDNRNNRMSEQQVINCFKNSPATGFEQLLTRLEIQYPYSWPDDLTLACFSFEKN